MDILKTREALSEKKSKSTNGVRSFSCSKSSDDPFVYLVIDLTMGDNRVCGAFSDRCDAFLCRKKTLNVYCYDSKISAEVNVYKFFLNTDYYFDITWEDTYLENE